MPFVGYNSILFDFYSLIDMKLSYINFLKNEYKDHSLNGFDKNKIMNMDIEQWKFNRIYGVTDIFSSVLTDDVLLKHSDTVFDSLYRRDEEIIFKNQYSVLTSMVDLIKAYKKAGDGIIKTTIRCDSYEQKTFIENIIDKPTVIVQDKTKVNMSNYTRLVVGYYKDALKYILNEPKSILVLNFRENFTKDNMELLNPELVINLGDINDIQVVSAYRDLDEIESKG